MPNVKLEIRVIYAREFNPDAQADEIHGAEIKPLGLFMRNTRSGSGFRNSEGSSTIRRGVYALKAAQQIVDAVNAAGGVDVDPFEGEYAHWIKELYGRAGQ